jgi:membrane-associated phospholipid phosphatase
MRKNIKQNQERLRRHLQRPNTKLQPLSRGLLFAGFLVAAIVIVLVALEIDSSVPGWRKTLPPALISDFQIVTRFGKSDWILYPTGIFLICAFLMNWGKLAARHRTLWTRIQIAIGFIFISVAGSGLIVTIVKRIIGRGRPVHFADAGIASFHPFSDASWAILFPRMTVPAVLIALAVGASRVIVGAHYPSDVIAGLVFGSAFTVLMARWMVMNNFAVFNKSRRLHLIPRPHRRKTGTTGGTRNDGTMPGTIREKNAAGHNG